MLQRTSIVDQFKLDTLSFSSVIEIGDSSCIQGFSRALAVQREAEIFFGKEGSFNYPVFTEPIPFLPLEENFYIQTMQLTPVIKVHNINLIGVSSSSVVHIGSSKQVSMESRVKHIRQLLPERPNGEKRNFAKNN